METTATDIARRLAGHGLILRGALDADALDGLTLGDGRLVGTLLLVGNAGRAMWRHFEAAPEAALADHPLDRWTRRVVGAIAAAHGAEARYPFGGPPHAPFQRWAALAEGLKPSPLMILIHPEYGLWHAWRAALLFAGPVALPKSPPAAHPCASCAEKPCMTSCPAGAISDAGYDTRLCLAHVRSADGAACREQGCLARLACPVGPAHAYDPAEAAHHMRWFADPPA
ncbi:hypothetical protein [Oceanibacterium hippocampi]|uniref:4Fe-4S ferredoxin-type domain-containing protein n=1 Tax=Oceanibacterium hippocampi TaxID=745714 RepID=A0A1Y5S899_9PROT|nr:hypothetical protein [Oceanibacterium hippocampi]SLN32091.1 hypothetical protein OCH7691_01174 [Oceanibacterium hippocampi]